MCQAFSLTYSFLYVITLFLFFPADFITLTAECDMIKALLHINESLFQERTFDYEKSID